MQAAPAEPAEEEETGELKPPPQTMRLYETGQLRQLRKVSQNGNSWAVSLPRAFLQVLHAGAGDYLELHMADAQTLVIRKYQPIERRRSTDVRR